MSRFEVRRMIKRNGYAPCSYCKQRVAKPALYRLQQTHGDYPDIPRFCCDNTDCLTKAHKSRVASQWRKL